MSEKNKYTLAEWQLETICFLKESGLDFAVSGSSAICLQDVEIQREVHDLDIVVFGNLDNAFHLLKREGWVEISNTGYLEENMICLSRGNARLDLFSYQGDLSKWKEFHPLNVFTTDKGSISFRIQSLENIVQAKLAIIADREKKINGNDKSIDRVHFHVIKKHRDDITAMQTPPQTK